MKSFGSLIAKIAAILIGALVTSFLGFVVTGAAYERWVVPRLVRQYPHDGQIGLEVFAAASMGAFVSGVFVLLIGLLWVIRRYRLTHGWRTDGAVQTLEIDDYSNVPKRLC